MIVYILFFFRTSDHFIIFPLIKKEIGFSDTQLALRGTTSFVIFYMLLRIPFGHLAKRFANKNYRHWCRGLEFIFRFDGFRRQFFDDFSLSCDGWCRRSDFGNGGNLNLSGSFPTSKRATTRNIYSVEVAVGAGLAAFLGDSLSQYGWRTAFMIVGFPGIIFALLVFFFTNWHAKKQSNC